MLPEALAHDTAGVANWRTLDSHETVVLAEAFAFAPVDFGEVTPAHEQAGPAHGKQGKIGKGPEAAVGDEDVARAKDATQQGKEPGLTRLPFAMRGAQQRSAAKAKDACQVNERPAAAGLLHSGLGPLLLVSLGIRGQDRGAIDNQHAPPVAARQGWCR